MSTENEFPLVKMLFNNLLEPHKTVFSFFFSIKENRKKKWQIMRTASKLVLPKNKKKTRDTLNIYFCQSLPFCK